MTNPYTSHIVHSDKPDALSLDLRGERNSFENEVIVKFIFDHKKGDIWPQKGDIWPQRVIIDHKRVIFDHSLTTEYIFNGYLYRIMANKGFWLVDMKEILPKTA